MTKRVWVEIEAPTEGYTLSVRLHKVYCGLAGKAPKLGEDILGNPVPILAVHHTPPTAISAEAQAVIDTSLKGHDDAVAEFGPNYADDRWRPHAEACAALRAAMTLPDPLDEVRSILENMRDNGDEARATRALAALDRAKEAR